MALYAAVCMRAVADVILYAYLPLHLHQQLGAGHIGLISLFLAVPAGVRFLAAPMWGRQIDRGRRYVPMIAVGLSGYVLLLIVLPRIAEPVWGLMVLAAGSLLASSFNPTARARLIAGHRRDGVFRLAAWHQWEAGGYFISGGLLGSLVASDPSFLPRGAAVIAALLMVCMGIIAATDKLHKNNKQSPIGFKERRRSFASLPRLPHGLSRAALLFLLCASLGWEAVAATFGLYFVHALDGTVRLYGAVLSVATLGSILSYRILAHLSRRYTAWTLLSAAAFGYTAMYGLISSSSVWIVALGYLMPLSVVVRTAINVLIAEEIDPAERGAALGSVEATETLAVVLGSLAGGVGADRFGLAAIPFLAFISSVSLYGVLLYRIRAQT